MFNVSQNQEILIERSKRYDFGVEFLTAGIRLVHTPSNQGVFVETFPEAFAILQGFTVGFKSGRDQGWYEAHEPDGILFLDNSDDEVIA